MRLGFWIPAFNLLSGGGGGNVSVDGAGVVSFVSGDEFSKGRSV